MDTLVAVQGDAQRRFEEQLAVTVEGVANNVGEALMGQLKGLQKLKPKRAIESLQAAQALSTLANIPSRFNPDASMSQGSTKASFNFNFGAPAQPIEQAKVVEAEVVTPDTKIE